MNWGWKGSKCQQISWRTLVFIHFYLMACQRQGTPVPGIPCKWMYFPSNHDHYGAVWGQSCYWCYVSLKQSGSAPSDPKMICYDDTTFLSHDPAASVWLISRLTEWWTCPKDEWKIYMFNCVFYWIPVSFYTYCIGLNYCPQTKIKANQLRALWKIISKTNENWDNIR